ncbi:hypothetical protein PENTCL1PPCAC_19309, partial [Pristionchus entomophagus]
QPVQQLQPAPVQERNHMASQELEAFLASISEPQDEDNQEQVVKMREPIVVEPEDEEYGNRSTDAIDSAPEFLAPKKPERSLSVTSTASLILDDVHSMRLPGEQRAEEEMERIHRSESHWEPSSHKSRSHPGAVPVPSSKEDNQEANLRGLHHQHPGEALVDVEMHSVHSTPEIPDEASTADDSSRSGRSFAFKDSSRTSSSTTTATSSQPMTSSASTTISSPEDLGTPRADKRPPVSEELGPGIAAGTTNEELARQKRDTVEEIEQGIDLPDDVILAVEKRSNDYYFPPDSKETPSSTAGPELPEEMERRVHRGVVMMMTYEVEEELRWLPPSAAGAATTSSNAFDDVKEVHTVADAAKDEVKETGPVQILYGHYDRSFKKNNADDERPSSAHKTTQAPEPISYTSKHAPAVKRHAATGDVPSSAKRRHSQEKRDSPKEHSFFLPLHVPSIIPDLTFEEVGPAVDEPMEEEVAVIVEQPATIRPLKIRLPADKSMDEPSDFQKSAISAPTESQPVSQRSINEASSATDRADNSDDSMTSQEEESPSDYAVIDSAGSTDAFNDDDDIILEGDETPRHLRPDNSSPEPVHEGNSSAMPKKPTYSLDEANDLAVAAYERLLPHIHSPGDPLGGAVVTGAFIESDSDVNNDEAMIKGKRIVLVGKHRNLVHGSSDEDGVKVEEMVSDQEEDGPATVRNSGDERSAQRLDREDHERLQPEKHEDGKQEMTALESVQSTIDDGAPEEVAMDSSEGSEETGEGLHLPGSDELGSGIDLPDDVILAVEKRSNDYYFPSDVKREDKDSSTDSPVNLAAEGTTDEPTSQKRNATEATGRGVVLPDDVLIAVEKRADEYYFPPDANEDKQSSTIDSTTETVAEPTNGQHTSQKRDVTEATGQGIDIRDDVLVDVEKRADEFYFSDEANTKPSRQLSTEASTTTPPRRVESSGSASTVVEAPSSAKTDVSEKLGQGIQFPDDVLIAVERRSNEYFFSDGKADNGDSSTVDDHGQGVTSTKTGGGKNAFEKIGSSIDDGSDTIPLEPAGQKRAVHGQGIGLPKDTPDAILGYDTELPNEQLLKKESPSNEYTSSGDHEKTQDSVNVSSASGRGDIPISTRAEPARPHGPTFGPGSGLTIPTTNDQETPDEASVGHGIDLPDSVLREVEKRSNEYYFAPEHASESPEASLDHTANPAATRNERDRLKYDANTVTIGSGIDVPNDDVAASPSALGIRKPQIEPAHYDQDQIGAGIELRNYGTARPTDSQTDFKDGEQKIGSGIDLPHSVVQEVERRSDQYFFEGEKTADLIPSIQDSAQKKPAHQQTADSASSVSDRAAVPRAEQGTGYGPTFGPGSGLMIPYSKKRDAETPDSEAVGDGISLPDDVVLEVEKRTNDYYFAGDHGQQTDVKSSSTQDQEGTYTTESPKDRPHDRIQFIGKGIELPDSVLLEVERRTNEYFFNGDRAKKDDEKPSSLTDRATSPASFPRTSAAHLTAPGHHSGSVPDLPHLEQDVFGPEETDQRSARLFQPVELVEVRAETVETIDRPTALGPPPSDANRDALYTELVKRTTSPRDLPLDQSTPLPDAPCFSPDDLRSLLKPSPRSSEHSFSPASPTTRRSIGEVRLVSAEEGIERFPSDIDIPVRPHSRSLAASELSVDLPTGLLPSPIPAERYSTHDRPQRFLTEELITTTVEQLLVIESTADVPPRDYSGLPYHQRSSDESSRDYVIERSVVPDHSGVTLVAAQDGSFNVPERWETFLSLEPPGDEDDVIDEEESGATPRDLDVAAAEVAYYQLAQDQLPSLESSGEFEGLHHHHQQLDQEQLQSGDGPRLMSIQEILRLTDNCNGKTTQFGLDVIQEESDAERSSRSTRYDIVRMPELIDVEAEHEIQKDSEPLTVHVDDHRQLPAPESATDVAVRLLAGLSPAQAPAASIVEYDQEYRDSDSEAEGEEWGQATHAAAPTEPFSEDLDIEDYVNQRESKLDEDDDVKVYRRESKVEDDYVEVQRKVEQLANRYYSIRDFSLSPDTGEVVYDSDGLNPASYRAEAERRRTPAYVVASRILDEVMEEWLIPTAVEMSDLYEERSNEVDVAVHRKEEKTQLNERDGIPSKSVEEEKPFIPSTEEMNDDNDERQKWEIDMEEEEEKAVRLPRKVKELEYVIPSRSVEELETEDASEILEENVDSMKEDDAAEEWTAQVPKPSVEQQEVHLRLPSMESEVEEKDVTVKPSSGEEVLDATGSSEEIVYPLPSVDDAVVAPLPEDQQTASPASLSDVAKTSDDDEGPTSTFSSPHDDEAPDTVREGMALSDDVIRDVEERANEYYGLGTSATRPEDVLLVEAVDVLSSSGVVNDDGQVRLVRSRDALRLEKSKQEERKGEYEREEASAEVEIRLENESMDSPIEAEAPLMHPSLTRLGIDSKQPSLDRQSSVASDEMDRSSLVKLKLENNLDRATTSHGVREGELNTADVERFWDYRYNKSPRTMRQLEDAKRRATQGEAYNMEKMDKEIRRMAREEKESGANLDDEINRKLSEAESKFLPREGNMRESIDSERLHSAISSRSSPSFVVDHLSEEGGDEENEPGIPLSSSGHHHFFHLRSSSSSSASTASFNSMCDGRPGRIHTEMQRERISQYHPTGSGLTHEEAVGGASQPTTELERLFPYIRHSSYYLNYYRSANLSMEKQAAPRNDYMLSRGLLRSSSTRDGFGMMRQSGSSDYIRDGDHTDRKSVTFRQRIEELVHTPPTIHRRLRSGSAQIRSILKSQHASNLLKVANENMLHELEQCVEERDRLSMNISATPANVSQLSPMTQSAQMRYRNHMVEQKERISVMIEDKYALLKETLRDDDMPSWLCGKEDSIEITLVDYKRSPHHRRLFRRQSSSFFYQSAEFKRGPGRPDLATANECARKLERLRSQFDRRDSEVQLEIGDNAGDLLSRISQRLSTSPNRMESSARSISPLQ